MGASTALAVDAEEAARESEADDSGDDVLEQLIEMDLEDLYELEVMTVTARKRSEGIQNVPVSVTAISGEELAKNGVTEVRDLNALVPSLYFNSSNTETSGSTIRLRGVGTTGNNAGLEGSVGVFLDGVFLSRPGVALTDLVDVEQIEVLRGPQGTLHGRNTSAGAVEIKTRKPNMNEFQSLLDYSRSSFSEDMFTGVINIPVVEDELAFRFSGGYHDNRGFAYSDFDNDIRTNDRKRFLLRGQMMAQPTEAVTVRLVADYFDANEKCCDAFVRFENDALAASFDTFVPLGDGFESDGVSQSGSDALDDRLTNVNRERENDQQQWGVMAETMWATPIGELTYLGSYREWDSTQTGDDDFTSNDLFFTLNQPADIDLTTHELRLNGDMDWLDWMFGASVSYEQIRTVDRLAAGQDYEDYVDLLAGTPGTVAGITGLAPGAAYPVDGNGDPLVVGNQKFKQDGTAFGIYTHNVVDLGDVGGWWMEDVLELTGGVRYNWEKKEGSFENGSTSPGCAGAIANSRVGFGFDLPGADALAPLLCSSFTSATVPEWDQEFKDDQVTGTVALSLDVAHWVHALDSGLAYISYSRGFKSGGFNLNSTAGIVNPVSSATIPDDPADDALDGNYLEEGDATFDSETVDAYELGFKTDFMDNRVRTNVTYFHYDIDDFQILEFDGLRLTTDNVKQVTVDGVELDILARPFHGLDLYTSVIYTDARYGSKGCNYDRSATDIEDLVCGKQLTQAPKWAVNVGGTYSRDLFSTDLTGQLVGSLGFNYQWRDKRRANSRDATPEERDGAETQDDSFTLDLRAAIEPDDYRWALEFWGRNITDERIANGLFAVPLRTGATAAYIEQPRTLGVTFRTTL